ncbi:MAG: dienelactone hydrolase family protein [Bacteroidetes bacterium]|nr:MAG: dienelactone hydrolase family protein [Bacteroidota bacterium]
MSKSFLYLVFGVALIFAACDNAQSGQKSEEPMATHAGDPAFRDAHEKPDSIAFEGRGEWVEFPTPDGKTGRAYVVKPPTPTREYLFVIHEWWGLNDHIRRETERLFDSLGQVTCMALDLYDGQVTDDPDEAGKIMSGVKQARAEAIIKGALALAGDSARVATVGWCFGGGWSLRASILAADRGAGCVMYYGMPVETAAELAPLKADILGIFGTKDDWINKKVIGKFEALTKATGKHFESHWFEAAHAFANPTSPRYNERAAQEANALALAFLREKPGR